MNIKFNDNIHTTGELELEIFKHGRSYQKIHFKNQLMNSGKLLIVNSLVGSDSGNKVIGTIGIGDSNIANDVTMLDLQGTSTYKKAIDDYIFPSFNQVQINFSFNTSEGNGINIKEFGLFSNDNTTLFNRVIWTGTSFIKTLDYSLQGSFLISVV